NVPDASLEESSPDRLGAGLDMAEANETAALPSATKPSAIVAQVVPAAQIARAVERTAQPAGTVASSLPAANAAAALAENSGSQTSRAGGTVVLDVEEGGIEVPSF